MSVIDHERIRGALLKQPDKQKLAKMSEGDSELILSRRVPLLDLQMIIILNKWREADRSWTGTFYQLLSFDSGLDHPEPDAAESRISHAPDSFSYCS